MAKKKSIKSARHDILKEEAQKAMEELLQDRTVPITQTLESMQELYDLIEDHIQGLEDDIEAGRG